MMSIVDSDGSRHFFNVGMQYYIAGRAAAQAQLVPVAGNLLHHAVEMLLKGDLSRTVPLGDLKNKYGHRLIKTWDAFKMNHSGDDLSAYDEQIGELDRFDKIRYPDDYFKHGALMAVGWGDRTQSPTVRQAFGPKVPEYILYVNEVDTLIARLFKLCRINPPAYWGGLPPAAVESLRFQNAECEGWVTS
jgi:hypothetical protein